MLSYQDQHWALVPGISCFQAFIHNDARSERKVHWSLNLEFQAIGPQWRRVSSHDRPSLTIDVSSFDIGSSWTHLARTNFWNAEPDPNAPLSFLIPPAGELFFTTRFPPEEPKHHHNGWVHWRVIEQKDALFLIELAGDPHGSPPFRPVVEESFVLADGTEETGRQQEDQSIKDHASFYLVEWVPFGLVTVRTPSNADPLAYAHGRARQLLGITREPEYINVFPPTQRPDMEDDPVSYEGSVYLHYHSYFNRL